MAENKTTPTQSSVTAFLNKIDDEKVREDCITIAALMQTVTKLEPIMWGSSIVGFGLRHYVYESGREGDTVVIGFSPRKQNIAIYLQGGVNELGNELAALGKHKTGKGCLYIKSLKDVNAKVLEDMFVKAFQNRERNSSEAKG